MLVGYMRVSSDTDRPTTDLQRDALLEAGVDPHDADTVLKIATELEVVIGTDPGAPWVTLDGRPVDAEIRGSEVTAHVSAVAAIPGLRRLLVDRQRKIIAAARGGRGPEGLPHRIPA